MLSGDLILPVTHSDGEEGIDPDADIDVGIILCDPLVRISHDEEIGTDILPIERLLHLIDISGGITDIEVFATQSFFILADLSTLLTGLIQLTIAHIGGHARHRQRGEGLVSLGLLGLVGELQLHAIGEVVRL